LASKQILTPNFHGDPRGSHGDPRGPHGRPRWSQTKAADGEGFAPRTWVVNRWLQLGTRVLVENANVRIRDAE